MEWKVAQREVVTSFIKNLQSSHTMGAPISTAIRANGFLFLSGMVPIDPATGQLDNGTTMSETRRILTNMKAELEAAGSSMDKVVKVNVYLANIGEWENMNMVYREFFTKDHPARTTVGAPLSFGFKVEIECVALA